MMYITSPGLIAGSLRLLTIFTHFVHPQPLATAYLYGINLSMSCFFFSDSTYK